MESFRENVSGRTVAGAALFVSVAVVVGEFFLPLRRCFGTVLMHTSRLASDGILNAGILEWVFRTLSIPGRSVFDWTAGYPLSNTLSGGENLLGWQLLYAPLRVLGAGIDFSYNFLLLVSLVASCVGAALLARRFGASAAGALLAGIVFAFAPFHVGHLLHLQTMAAAGLPFVFLFLDRYLEAARPIDAAALGAAGIATSLCSAYFGVFLLLMLPLFVALELSLGHRRLDGKRLAGLALTGALCGAILLPVALHYFEFGGAFGYRHSRSVLGRFSLPLSSFTRFPEWERFWSGTSLARGEDLSAAFPGVTAAFLMFPALGLPAASPEERSRRRILAAGAAIAALFALGPDPRVHAGGAVALPGWAPLPGKIFLVVRAVRWPMRMYFFSLLFGGILAGLGLTALLRDRSRRVSRLVEIAVLALLLFEYRPKPGYVLARSTPVAPPLQMSDAYPFLASEKDPGGIVELPIRDPDGYTTPNLVRSVFASAGHRRRVVAFFGAVRLPPVENLLAAAQSVPLPASRRYLAASGVDRLVVHRTRMPADAGRRLCEDLRRAGYRTLFEGRESTVFEISR